MDYRFTLNLPETNFSMKANLSLNEIDILKFWEKINLYDEKYFNKKIFVLNDGPPYSNGDIHIGHAFNKILKDIVCKFKRLDNFCVSFVPGWDCHGLPIELNVEKIIKKSKFLVSDSDFRTLCRKYAEDQINVQKTSFIRLGVNASWNDFYKTMNFGFEAAIVKTFRSLLENGYIYSSIRPVYWCFDCTSALADAELEYFDKQSDSVYVFFEIFDFENFFDKFYFPKVGFIVWTTTPWTLPFNEAIALNAKAEYVLVAYKEVGYIFDKKLLDFVVKKLCFNRIHVLHTFNANFFLNMRIVHPIYSKFVKVVLSDHVSSDSGTGCVHIAPGYGYDDYKVALKFGLPIQNKIDINGYFYGDVEEFSSLNIKDVNPTIILKLKEKNTLLLHESILHRYPHCWRHKSTLIFRTTNQWFLSVDNKLLRDKAISISKNFIKWIPENGKNKIIAMMYDRPDWCISRQRVWGVPIFLFVNKNDESLHPRSLLILDEIIDIIKTEGTNFWYERDVFSYFNVDSNFYRKVIDVLDVWYDSSSVYEFILTKFSFLKIPFDLCLEGNDQYRGWFQSSLINSVANYGISPFKTIVAHGFVLDGFGRKMSKSLNNVISPNDVIKIYGADVLRLWVSSVNYSFDVSISEEILSRICESYRKIRNTFRFFLSNVYDFSPENDLVCYADIFYIDKWILNKFICFKNDLIKDFNEYKFYSIYKKIYNFCIDEFGSKYFEIIKDRLYLTRASSIFRLSCQSVLYYILYDFVKIISPILSFTADEIWKNIKCVDNSVHLSIFDLKVNMFLNHLYFNIIDFIFFDKLFYIKDCVNKIIEKFRHEFSVGSSLELRLIFYCNFYWFNFFKNVRDDLFLFFLVSNITYVLDFKNSNIYFDVLKSELEKCERCWHRNVSFNNKLKICNRCLLNIYYFKENRRFF